MKGLNRFIRLMCGIALLLALWLAAMPVAAQQTTVTISAPPSVERGAGGEITVTLNGSNIGAFEIAVSCDTPQAIRLETITDGTGPSGFSIVSGLKEEENTAAICGFMSTTPITESTVVASVSFTATGKAAQPVALNVTGRLYDPEGNEIETIFSGAEISVTGTDNASLLPVLGGAGGVLAGLIIVITIVSISRARRRGRRADQPEVIRLRFE